MLARLACGRAPRIRRRHPPAIRCSTARVGSHRLLYVLVLGMAASGGALALEAGLLDVVLAGRGALPADFWVFAPRAFHYAFSRALMLLIALHVAGALYHAVIRRDGLLRRMSFGRRAIAAADRGEPRWSEARR